MGKMSQDQVDGLNQLLDLWERSKFTDRRWLAYMLATAKAETGSMRYDTREAKESWQGRFYGKPDHNTGQIYYGRGWPQETLPDNYKKSTHEINSRNLIGRKVDLYNNPDEALKKDVSWVNLSYGLAEGWYTKHKLPDFFNGPYSSTTEEDWANARNIVNPGDKDEYVGGMGEAFFDALTLAAKQASQPQKPPLDTTTAELISRLKQKTGAKHIHLVY